MRVNQAFVAVGSFIWGKENLKPKQGSGLLPGSAGGISFCQSTHPSTSRMTLHLSPPLFLFFPAIQ